MKSAHKDTEKNALISTENEISAALAQIRQRVSAAEQRFNRDPGSVQLLAVSKTKPVSDIQAAVNLGQNYFAENYLQEAIAKIESLNKDQLEWHFIGSIQSNKIRDIAKYFQWVHTIDRAKVVEKLSELRPDHLPPVNVCLQINISGEASKSGVEPQELKQLAEDCACLPNIRLRGLMAMPAQETDFEKQRNPFRELRRLFAELRTEHPELDTLSMGTTTDLEAAIAEGATMVRVGTAIFGARN
ncbi:MAG: pyridoxal phosphate enzyme (YggS family) [Gammaproteobacteria bacterium]|jgi:pyridoxal phosphate enzyme (YggS family)